MSSNNKELVITFEVDGKEPVVSTVPLSTLTDPSSIGLDTIRELVSSGDFSLSWVSDHLKDSTLSVDVLVSSITNKVVPLLGEENQKYIDIVKSLIVGNTFSISDIETFVKVQIFGDDTKDIDLLLNSVKSLIETGKVDLDGVKTLIVDQVLKLDCVKDLVNSGVIKEETLQNLVKDGHFNQNALVELVTDGLISLDFIKDLDEKGYIDAKGLEEALKNIDFSSFDTLTDPDTIEQIARGILPEKFKDWSIVAGDLVRYPEKAVYELGEKALDLAGAEATAFIQGPGKEKLKVILDSVPGIGAFFQTTGLDELASSGITTLAIEGVGALKSLIKGKLGFGVKSVPPAPYITKILFTGAPKVVYALNESFSYDGIVVEATMSDGTKKELDYSSLAMTGFDSRHYTSEVEKTRNGTTVMTFSLASGSNDNGNLSIDYPYIVAEKFLNGLRYGGSSTNKTQYIVGEDFSTKGLILKATYTDNTESDVPESAITISGFDNTKVGAQTVKAWYGGEYFVELSVQVIAPKPQDIHLVRIPDKTIFYVDEEFNAHGLLVTGDYMIDGELVNLPIPSGLLDIPNPILSKKEEVHEIKILYYDHALSYNIKVIDQSFIFLQVQTKPKKLQFRPGERFTTDGLLIKGIKGDMTRMIVDSSDYKISMTKIAEQVEEKANVNSLLYKRIRTFENSSKKLYYFKEPVVIDDLSNYYFTKSDVGSLLTITITCKKNLYDDTSSDATVEYISTSYDIEVLPERNDFLRYSVTKLPQKLVYTKYDKLDLTGIEISALYGQNDDPTGKFESKYDRVVERNVVNIESFDIQPQTFESIVFESGILEKSLVIYCTMNHSLHKKENLESKVLLHVGYQYLEDVPLINEGHICSFPVKIIDGNIESISVSVLPKIDYLFGEQFDSTGMEVVGIYTNGYRWIIPNDQLIIEGFDSSLPRHRKIKVIYRTIKHPTTKNQLFESVYNELSDYFTVNISRGNLDCIAIKSLPTKVKYYPKESFDIRGLSVLALYNSGYTEKVSLNDSRLKILGFYSLRVKKVVPITVDFSGYRAVFNVSIVQRNIHHITLEAPPKNVVYIAGLKTPASWLGMRVLAHNTNGETSQLDINDLTIVGFDSDCPYGLIECSVDYEGYNSSYSTALHLLILEGAVTKMTMRTKPIKLVYGLFDKIDLTGMVVEIECENSVIPRVVPNELLTVRGFDTMTVTSDDPKDSDYTRTCVLSLGGAIVDNISFAYTVHNSNFKGLVLHPSTQKYLPEIYQSEDSETHVVSYPLNMLPYDGILVEQYDTNDGVYEIKRYIGDVVQDTDNYSCSCQLAKDDNGAEYGYTLNITKADIERTEAILSYTFGILCKEVRPSYLVSAPTLPEKRTYLLGEKLNLDNCSLTLRCKHPSFPAVAPDGKLEPYQSNVMAIFDNGFEKEENYYKNLGISVIAPDMSYSGEKTVKISTCLGHCWEYKIMVVSPDDVPISLDIESEPKKLDYNLGDQEIDLSGIEVYQTYSDGSKIKISESGLKVESFDTSVVGLSKVIISYIGQIYTTYDIYVHEVPTSLVIIQNPDKLEYYPDETIDLTGLVLQAEFVDERGHVYTQDVDLEECTVHNFESNLQKIMTESNLQTIRLGSKMNGLYSIEYRGCVIFIPYKVIAEEPCYVSISPLREEKKDNIPIIDQRQKVIDKSKGVLYLKDVIVTLGYPNGSRVETTLEDVWTLVNQNGQLHLTFGASSSIYNKILSAIRSSNNRGDVSYQISLYGYDFYYMVNAVTDGYYELNYSRMLVQGADPESKYDITVVPSNSLKEPLDIVFALKKSNSNSTEELIYSQSKDILENVPNITTIGSHAFDSKILYVKDGYCIALKENQ